MDSDILQIKGYNLLRNDRTWGRNGSNVPKKGGGTCVYVRENLVTDVSSLGPLNRSTCDIEIQWVEIQQEHCKNIIIANCYRPPTGNIDNFLKYLGDAVETINLDRKDLFIMGDINIDTLDKKKGVSAEWRETIKTLGLEQVIREATRYSQQKSSCIDTIITNCTNCSSAGVIDMNLSDHEAVFVVKKKIKTQATRSDFYGRSYRYFDKDVFCAMLNDCNWDHFYNAVDVNEKWAIYIKNVKDVTDRLCPMKLFRTKSARDPWITDEIIEQIKDKDRALRRAKRTKNDQHWQIARRLRNDCLRATRNSKSDFIKNELNNNAGDSKKFWKNINTLLKPNSGKSTILDLKEQDSGISITHESTADFINNYFAQIGPKLAEHFKEPWKQFQQPLNENMGDVSADIDEVTKLCNNISTTKSSAIKDIASRVIKAAFLWDIGKFTDILNLSLLTNIVPDSWKVATVIPIPKEGKSSDVNNLRPISLLPVQGKILEKIVNDRLTNYLEQHNLLDSKQGGFRSKHSTIDTAVRFTEAIYKNMNDNKFTVATFVDMRKAFDTVNHHILRQKLLNLGVNVNLCKWIGNYLSNRMQCTLANGHLSQMAEITCGVPQGSVLGPKLFLIYVNDMGNSIHNLDYFLYADEAVLFMSGSVKNDVQLAVNRELKCFGDWCNVNALTVNTKKTKFLCFGTNSQISKCADLTLRFATTNLDRVHIYKYLGITLDSHLNFKKHIMDCRKTSAHKVYMLSKVRRYIDQETSIHLYKSMIMPVIDYGDIVYSGAPCTILEKLQKIQNRALRICLQADYHLPVITMHQRTNVPNLKVRRYAHLNNYIYSRKQDTEYLVTREVRTRRFDAPVLETVRPQIEKYKKGTMYRGIAQWNTLDVQTRNTDEVTTFKEAQKKRMMETLYI